MLEECARERVKAAAFALEQPDDLYFGLLDDSPRLFVDAFQRRGRGGRQPGSRKPSCGPSAIASGPSSSLMPQRATIPRAIIVRFWMSDSAPVVVSP